MSRPLLCMHLRLEPTGRLSFSCARYDWLGGANLPRLFCCRRCRGASTRIRCNKSSSRNPTRRIGLLAFAASADLQRCCGVACVCVSESSALHSRARARVYISRQTLNIHSLIDDRVDEETQIAVANQLPADAHDILRVLGDPTIKVAAGNSSKKSSTCCVS
eukprot:SAG31_NODE_87_length_26728_cov_40.161591_21_plen_162_part_00